MVEEPARLADSRQCEILVLAVHRLRFWVYGDHVATLCRIDTMPGDWRRVTKAHPCPVCEKPDWCMVTGPEDSPFAAICSRIKSRKPAGTKGAGWVHRLREDPDRAKPVERPKPRRATDTELERIWRPIAAKLHEERGCHLEELARQLGVASWSLHALRVGYGYCANLLCWSFPEMNHLGQVIGINRRLVHPCNGKNKMAAPDGRRGITYCPGWQQFNGPVLVVEGGSDVAAGITLDLATLGRPSCRGGTEYLVPLLRQAHGRKIIVIGERDRKAHEDLSQKVRERHNPTCRGCPLCWPGKAGAIRTAKELAHGLGRPIGWKLLPDEAKDLRKWLTEHCTDPEDMDEAKRLGQQLIKRLT